MAMGTAALVRLRNGTRAHPWRATGAGVVIAALAAGGGYWLSGRSTDPAAATTTTRLVAASTGTIQQSVSTTGTIEPADDESLNFAASGRVTAVKVAQGDKVKKGQVLARIDSAALSAALAQARASLANAQARVAADEDSSTTTDTQLSADKAAVTAAKGQVSSAKTALADATLRSPIKGIVASVSLQVGEEVSGSSGNSGGSGLGTSGNGGSGSSNGSGSGSGSSAQVEVVGTSRWIVNATVDATELAQVKKGEQAQITTDGATGTVFGTVSSVGILPSSSSSTTAYPVVIDVTGAPKGLHSGATATVAVIYRQLANVLTVPSLAVHTDGTTSYVYVQSGSKQVRTNVTVGIASGGEVQIKSGLKSGDQVVVATPTRTGTARTGTGNGTGNSRFPGGFGGGNFPGGFGGGGNVQRVVPAGGN